MPDESPAVRGSGIAEREQKMALNCSATKLGQFVCSSIAF
jgi:hypothetical protein